MKKLVSLLLTICFIFSLTPVVIMAEEVADTPVINGTVGGVWEVISSDITADIVNVQLSTANVLDTSAPYSLRIEHLTASDTGVIAVKIPVTLEENAKYRINFKSTELMSAGTPRQNMIFGPSATVWVEGSKQFSSSTGVTSTNLGTVGDLIWYEHTFDYNSKAKEMYLTYEPKKGLYSRYFDDFKISKINYDAEGTEIGTTALDIPNWNFDTVSESEPEGPEKVISGTLGNYWEVTSKDVTAEQLNFQLSTENVLDTSAPNALKLEATEKVDGVIAVKIPVTLEENAKYRINFKSTEIMGNGKARQNLILGPSATGWAEGSKQFASSTGVTSTTLGTVGDKTWYEHTFDYTSKGTAIYLSYNPKDGTGTRYFDDFKISKINYDAEGAETGTTALDIPNWNFDMSDADDNEDEIFNQVIFEGDFSSSGDGAKVVKALEKIENGNIMASVKVENEQTDQILPITYVIALYNGETMVQAALVSKNVSANGSDTISAVLNVADINDGDYMIKTFLWDENQKPLKTAGVITE